MCGKILVIKRREIRDAHVVSNVHSDKLIDPEDGQQHSRRGGRHETKKLEKV